jgi:hypothetical protein
MHVSKLLFINIRDRVKVKHTFIVTPLPKWNDFDYTIAYKLNWDGKQYGQYGLMREEDMSNPWPHLRALVREKHSVIEDLSQ